MLLSLKNVKKSYPMGESGRQIVLDDINFNMDAAERISIVGPSGVGKSTLLNIIGGLDKPDEGEVILDGNNLSKMNDNQLSLYRNTDIGFVFQTHLLLPQFNLIENVLIPTLINKNSGDIDYRKRAGQLIEKVGLKDHIHKYPSQLSIGECQRVAVVRALINAPRILLADEPTGSLDELSANGLADLLIDINKQENVALIVVTHSTMLADKMNRKLHLKQGKLYDRS